jgi:hypothetical protein
VPFAGDRIGIPHNEILAVGVDARDWVANADADADQPTTLEEFITKHLQAFA